MSVEAIGIESRWGPPDLDQMSEDPLEFVWILCRFRKFWPPHFRKICPVWRGDELGQTRCRSMQRGEG
jgi:hypothetical protein